MKDRLRFIFRTTGFNSIRTLATRLRYFHALSGRLLATMPLELRLRGKSTALSHRTPIYYVDLTLRAGQTMAETLASAREEAFRRSEAGFDQHALEEAAREGFANGSFEETEEESASVLEEFYPEEQDPQQEAAPSTVPNEARSRLALKMNGKATGLAETMRQQAAPGNS